MVLTSLGFATETIQVCENEEQVRRTAAEKKMVLIRDFKLLDALPLDVIVEATGHPEVSVQIATNALRRGVHVTMVTKETESVAGPYLNRLAQEHGVVYTTPDGDQPSSLIGLVTWARVLGFEIVAAGKSSEYDYVFDPVASQGRYTDRTVSAPTLGELWHLGNDVSARLRQRSEALHELPQSATPDYCEMNVVANSTGLVPACDALNYPLCRIPELADIFIPKEDGGLLERTGVVDVFNCLRRDDEPSFGGGVFVIVRCTDPEVWETLRAKGHVVSRNGKYACIYLPYHLLGLETPMTLFSAVLHGRPSGSDRQAAHAIMVARTQRDFQAGERLHMGGHHHVIDGATALLLPATAENLGKAPFYLAANKSLKVDVPRDTIITPEMLDLAGSALHAAWQQVVSQGRLN